MRVKLAEAARLAGKSRATIHRAMKAGRISFTKDAAGARVVDVAELERAFGVHATVARNASRDAQQPAETLALRREVELLREMLERERSITDTLRQAIERRDEQVKLLTDQRPWWRRLWGPG